MSKRQLTKLRSRTDTTAQEREQEGGVAVGVVGNVGHELQAANNWINVSTWPSCAGSRDLPRPKTITYAPTMTELMDGGKNWLIPPSTMITPTAMLTRRL